MSIWRSSKAREVLRALEQNGWSVKREAKGSHKVLSKFGWPDYVLPFTIRKKLAQ